MSERKMVSCRPSSPEAGEVLRYTIKRCEESYELTGRKVKITADTAPIVAAYILQRWPNYTVDQAVDLGLEVVTLLRELYQKAKAVAQGGSS